MTLGELKELVDGAVLRGHEGARVIAHVWDPEREGVRERHFMDVWALSYESGDIDIACKE